MCKSCLGDDDVIESAIANGIPLPEGYGDLIERETIYDSLIRSYRADKKDYPERGKDYRVGLSNAIDLLNVAPADPLKTVVEKLKSMNFIRKDEKTRRE